MKNSPTCLRMSKTSAGILVYKRLSQDISVLLLHLGGPIWASKDCWTIPKGEVEPGEDELAAAKREFLEEVGLAVPLGHLIDLGSISQSLYKTNHIWAVESDIDITKFVCNRFVMEWPPKSGQKQSFLECDRAQWFSLNTAREKIMASQSRFLDFLKHTLQAKN